MADKLNKKALLELAQGDLDEFRQALSKAPKKLLKDFIQELDEDDHPKAGEACYRELIARDPNDQDSTRWLGTNLYYYQRDAERAHAHLLEAREKFPDNTEIGLTLATNLSWGLGRHRDALPVFEDIVERKPNDETYRSLLGWCLLWLGEFETGLEQVEASIQCGKKGTDDDNDENDNDENDDDDDDDDDENDDDDDDDENDDENDDEDDDEDDDENDDEDEDDDDDDDDEDDKEMLLANHVYLYLLGDAAGRDEALRICRDLVDAGQEVEDWDFSELVRHARERHHPESEWLEHLVAAVGKQAEASRLDGWSAWEAAYDPPLSQLKHLNTLERPLPSTTRVQVPKRRDFLARYRAGEYEVWEELLNHAPFITQHPDAMAEARGVAEALMQRVRQNVDAVRATLSEAGAALDVEEKSVPRTRLQRLIANLGPLPVSLEALWSVVGSIDLRPQHPQYDYGECALEDEGISLAALDPLSFDSLDVNDLIDRHPDIEDGEEEDEEDDDDDEDDEDNPPMRFRFAPDFLYKQGDSDGPTSPTIELPAMNRYDAIDPDVHHGWEDTTLVGYLRACFEYGGFPLLRVAQQPLESIDKNHRRAFKKVRGPWGPPAERLRARLRRNLVDF